MRCVHSFLRPCLLPCYRAGVGELDSSRDAVYQVSLTKWAPLLVQSVKHLPAMQETRLRLPGQEDPLDWEVATHCSILAWRSPWTEEPGGLQTMGSQESDTTEQLNTRILRETWQAVKVCANE